MELKNFTCWKITDKKNPAGPDYRLTAKIGDKFVEIGAGWIKGEGDKKFISFQLADKSEEYKREGWHLDQDDWHEVSPKPEDVPF